MNPKLKKLSPLWVILLGLLLLFFLRMAILAGVCLLIGIVMVLESIWPEEWEAEKLKEN